MHSRGGSQHRAISLANGVNRYSPHKAYLFCEQNLNDVFKEFNLLDNEVHVTEGLFYNSIHHSHIIYQMDRLIVLNSDSHDITRLDFWQGQTKHHKQTVDLCRIPQITFLFNALISPSQHLYTIKLKCKDVRILCANSVFMREINSEKRFDKIRTLPRMKIESPIDPATIISTKTPSDKIRIGKHARPFLNKFNPDHPELIKRINEKYGAKVHWDFMGVPGVRKPELQQFDNVTLRYEYSTSVADYLQNIDVFLFYSKWNLREAWSRSVAEAMVSGCPILANNQFGNIDQILHGNNGFLCDSLEDYEAALSHLIENPQLIQTMAKNSQTYAKQFTLERVINKLLTFIEA